MNQITEILDSLEAGDVAAGQQLLPLVYDELRKLAAAKLNQERPDHTLQATALVHEAWMRITDDREDGDRRWNSRGHFFGAAAEAMRRILIDHARAAKAEKRGGGRQPIELETWNHPAAHQPEKLLELNEALDRLEKQGLVRRTRSEADRRVVTVTILGKGLSLLSDLDKPIAELTERLFPHMSDAELKKAIRLLEKMRAHCPSCQEKD